MMKICSGNDPMHGIISLLDEEHTNKTIEIWDELASRCGLTAIEITPFPHFSWQIAEDYDIDCVEVLLDDLASQQKPFNILTSGLALFSGEKPVLYIPIVRSAELSKLHAYLWEQLEPLGDGISAHYAPQIWIPHITLATDDLDAEAMACVMGWLPFKSLNWQIDIDNFAFGFQLEGEKGFIRNRFDFDV